MVMARSQHIAENVKRIRESKKITLSELSRKSGVSRNYLYMIERGESSPSWEKLSAIARALEVLVAEITGEPYQLQDMPIDIPESLQDFAQELDLPSADVVMLSRIHFRGKRPTEKMEWAVLYTVIKGTLADK